MIGRMAGRSRPLTTDGQRLAYRVASLLLCYPDAQLRGRLDDDVTPALPAIPEAAWREPLAAATAWLLTQPPGAAEAHHVSVFDLTRRSCPYLTYYRYGDTRQRGMALLALKHTYRRAGVELTSSELPDYLPIMLEFAALTGDPGVRLLAGNRAPLQLLRLALHDRESPYADVLDAVDATLPPLTERQQADVRRLAAEGPPKEDVGLDPVGTSPFAPPELLGLGTEPPR